MKHSDAVYCVERMMGGKWERISVFMTEWSGARMVLKEENTGKHIMRVVHYEFTRATDVVQVVDDNFIIKATT